MKPYDKYKLNIKLIKFGRLSWDLLVMFSLITFSLYIFITIILFWTFLVFYVNQLGVDISNKVLLGIRIFTLTFGILIINWILKLFRDVQIV